MKTVTGYAYFPLHELKEELNAWIAQISEGMSDSSAIYDELSDWIDDMLITKENLMPIDAEEWSYPVEAKLNDNGTLELTEGKP